MKVYVTLTLNTV